MGSDVCQQCAHRKCGNCKLMCGLGRSFGKMVRGVVRAASRPAECPFCDNAVSTAGGVEGIERANRFGH